MDLVSEILRFEAGEMTVEESQAFSGYLEESGLLEIFGAGYNGLNDVKN